MAIALQNVELYGGKKFLIFKSKSKCFQNFIKLTQKFFILFCKKAVQTTVLHIVGWKVNNTMLFVSGGDNE